MQAAADRDIGWLTFNNSVGRNAMSMEIWQGIGDVRKVLQKDGAALRVVSRALEPGGDVKFDGFHRNQEGDPMALTRNVEIGSHAQPKTTARAVMHRWNPVEGPPLQ